MSKDLSYKIFLGVLFGLLILMLTFQPTPINWAETYSKEDKNPYGMFLTCKLMEDIFPGKNIYNSTVPFHEIKPSDENVNYLIFTHSFESDASSISQMVKSAKNGSHIFIAALFFDPILKDTLGIETGDLYSDDLKTRTIPQDNILKTDSVFLTFTKTSAFEKYYYNKKISSFYFDVYDSGNIETLAVNEKNKPVFIKIKYGKGAFYLNTVPIAFTNYYMVKNNNHYFVSECLSQLPVANTYRTEFYHLGRQESESFFRVILNKEALKWGYYVLFVAILLFVIFEVKRKQRVIPVITPPKNATLGFVNIIGSLYYQKRDNKDLALKKITYFKDSVYSKYYLKMDLEDPSLTARLGSKTGISHEKADYIISTIKNILQKKYITENDLWHLNKILNLKDKENNLYRE